MKTILIVEDNEKNLKLVRDLLQVKGYRTLEAETGEGGVEVAKREKPDLILMDIQLPGMSGVDALNLLRADVGTASIPVAAMTASVMQHDRAKITGAGFDAFIAKPINVKDFLATVSGLLETK